MAGWKSTTRSVFNGWQRARDHSGCTLPDIRLFYCAQGTKDFPHMWMPCFVWQTLSMVEMKKAAICTYTAPIWMTSSAEVATAQIFL